MAEPLRVVILDDSAADAELVIRALRKDGYSPEVRVVADEAGYAAALDPGVDLVLADYTLPGYDGMSALRRLRETGLDIPFIMVSGTIGEERAVAAMIEGAASYVLKDRLGSLAAYVRRALKDAAARAQRRRAETALRRSEARYRRLFNAAQDGLLVLEAGGGTVLEANPVFLGALGLSGDGIVGVKAADLPPLRRADPTEVDFRILHTLPAFACDALHLEAMDGRPRTFEFMAARHAFEESGVVQCVFHDVTEQRRLQAEFLQAQKAESVGVLAGGVAHDFNNLLMVVQANSGFVLDALPEGDPRRPDVEQIRDAAEKGAALTRQLLIFSRHQVPRAERADLAQLLRGLEKTLRRLLGEDIAVHSELCDGSAFVKIDPGQFEQLILNLATNARDAMPDGGRLTLSLSMDGAGAGRRVTLEVADTGCGMAPEVLRRAFDPFFTTKPPGKGTGLGLPTVQVVVREAGGQVEARSRPGKGTTLRVSLPWCPPEPEGAQAGAAAPRVLGAGEVVLLVEDDVLVRSVSERMLRTRGYAVRTAANAAEALGILRDPGQPVALLLSDIVLPGPSGADLASEAVRLRPGLKVLFVTGFAEHAAVERLTRRGCRILRKPFGAEELAREVRAALDAPACLGAGG